MEGGEKKTLAAPFLLLFSVKPASTELRALSRSGSGFRGGRGAVRKEERALFSRCASHVDGFFLPLGQAAHNLSLSSKIRAVGEHGRRMSPEVCRKRVRTVVGAIRASETSEKRNKKEKEKTCEGNQVPLASFSVGTPTPSLETGKKKGRGGSDPFCSLALSRSLALSVLLHARLFRKQCSGRSPAARSLRQAAAAAWPLLPEQQPLLPLFRIPRGAVDDAHASVVKSTSALSPRGAASPFYSEAAATAIATTSMMRTRRPGAGGPRRRRRDGKKMSWTPPMPRPLLLLRPFPPRP